MSLTVDRGEGAPSGAVRPPTWTRRTLRWLLACAVPTAACAPTSSRPARIQPDLTQTTTTSAAPLVVDASAAKPPERFLVRPNDDAPMNPVAVTSERLDSATANDEQIVGVLEAINAAEVAQGHALALAAMGSQRAQVRQFAQQLSAEHVQDEIDLEALLARSGMRLQDSAPREQIARRTEEALLSLRSPDGSDAQRSAVDAQVDLQQNLLDLLGRYALQARNPDLRSHLRQTRATVAEHLEAAQALRASLRDE